MSEVIEQKTSEQKPQTSSAPVHEEAATISEKKFMRDHTTYSAISSWLFAIAGATNIGVLSVLSSKILTAAEQGKPLFKSVKGTEAVMGNKQFNRIAILMTGFGAACMGVSNWLESKKVVTEWQLGAGKLQRKANIAEKEGAQAVDEKATTNDKPERQSKKWASAVQANPKRLVTRLPR